MTLRERIEAEMVELAKYIKDGEGQLSAYTYSDLHYLLHTFLVETADADAQQEEWARIGELSEKLAPHGLHMLQEQISKNWIIDMPLSRLTPSSGRELLGVLQDLDRRTGSLKAKTEENETL